MVHVAVNKYDFEKNQHFRVRFWGGGHQKAYAVYAFINVDNCERPLTDTANLHAGTGERSEGRLRSWSGGFGSENTSEHGR